MKDALDTAKTERAKKRVRNQMKKFRETLETLPEEIGNTVMAWTPKAIGSVRGNIETIAAAFAGVAPKRTDEQLREASTTMLTQIASIQSIFAQIGDTIGAFSIGPINAVLISVKKKMTAMGSAFAGFTGAMSEKFWQTIATLLSKIDVKEWVATIQKWTDEIKGTDAEEIATSVEDNLKKIGKAIGKIVEALVWLGNLVGGTVDVVKTVHTRLAGQEPWQIEEKKKREAREKEIEQAGGFWADYIKRQAKLQKEQRDPLLRWFPSLMGQKPITPIPETPELAKLPEPKSAKENADEMRKALDDGSSKIKTAGEATGTKVTTSFNAGSDHAHDQIVSAFSTGGIAAAAAIAQALSNVHINVTGSAPLGADMPASR
jgi:hypothetical protein